jgi:hypothetical protein
MLPIHEALDKKISAVPSIHDMKAQGGTAVKFHAFQISVLEEGE